MPFADYVYRNADDTRRVRIFKRENGRWVFDVFSRDGSIETSSNHAEDYGRKIDARDAAVDVIGPLVSIQVSEVRAGWDSPGQRVERPGDERLTKNQLRQLLAYARHIKDTRLAVACSRAIDGDSAYHSSIMERCAAAYAGARMTREFKQANRAPADVAGHSATSRRR